MILRVVSIGVAFLVGWTAPTAGAQNLTVLAAASLKEALDDVSTQFQRAGSYKVAVAYAASSALARQVENGAPADVFISADLDWMDYVDQRKLLRAGTRVNLLRNRLVLIAPLMGAYNYSVGAGVRRLAGLWAVARVLVRLCPEEERCTTSLPLQGTPGEAGFSLA